jgi:hypothetical protein
VPDDASVAGLADPAVVPIVLGFDGSVVVVFERALDSVTAEFLGSGFWKAPEYTGCPWHR